MNYLDVIIAIPLIWGAWKGFQRGIIFEIAMIIGLVLGFYLAFKFNGLFTEWIGNATGIKSALPYISFFIVFAAVVLLLIFLAKLLEAILKISSLNAFNKAGGAIFGLIKFGLVISVILALFRPVDSRLNILKPEIKQQSLLYEPVLKSAQYLFPALKDIQQVFRKNIS